MYKQEVLLRQALKESKLNIKDMKIEIDHLNGFNYINGYKMGIKYPKYYFKYCKILSKKNKKISYYFNGNMSVEGKRKELLLPFLKIKNSKIIESNFGRINIAKKTFNIFYFWNFCRSSYGLCPHQLDWPGAKDTMWTYRFIEACMSFSLPILFEECPLGNNFINGFNYLWNKSVVKSNINSCELTRMTEENYLLAYNKFTLSEYELLEIANNK